MGDQSQDAFDAFLKRHAVTPATVPLYDAYAFSSTGTVKLWGVQGRGGCFYPTKVAAEIAAREAFPNEDPFKRYARLYSKTFHQEGT